MYERDATNKGRMQANIEVRVNLFYFNVDYTHDERANIAKGRLQMTSGTLGISYSAVLYIHNAEV